MKKQNTDYDQYFNLPLAEKHQLVVSMRFWIMWDIWHSKEGIDQKCQTDVAIEKLILKYGKELVMKLVEFCQNSLPGDFLAQHGIDSTLMH